MDAAKPISDFLNNLFKWQSSLILPLIEVKALGVNAYGETAIGEPPELNKKL